MSMYSLDYNKYRFVFRIEEKNIEIYKGGFRIHVLRELPKGILWENIKNSSNDQGLIKDSDLAKKLIEFYESEL
jgi:hypothetical protein